MLRRGAGGESFASFDERYRLAGCARLVLVGLGVGFLTGFFGVGGGFPIVPALIGNLRLGTLDWTLTALFAIGGVLGVLAGGRVAGRLPDRTLRGAFTVMTLAVALYTFGHSVTALMAG